MSIYGTSSRSVVVQTVDGEAEAEVRDEGISVAVTAAEAAEAVAMVTEDVAMEDSAAAEVVEATTPSIRRIQTPSPASVDHRSITMPCYATPHTAPGISDSSVSLFDKLCDCSRKQD